MIKFSQFLEKSFILLIILASVFAFYNPSQVLWIAPNIKWLLMVIMFSMGITLNFNDIKIALIKPKPLIVGVLSQYLIMPLIAFALANWLKLPPEVAVGLVLVGACPGGTASNLIVYLAKGDLALSVAMTSFSTLIAPIMIPLLMISLAGQWLEIDFIQLFSSTAELILIPVIAGMFIKNFLKNISKKISEIIPSLAIISIILIVSALTGINASSIKQSTLIFTISTAVILHNSAGLFLGYLISRFFGFDKAKRRAISIEVGMQNSGLGAVLALSHFGPAAALPAIIFSIYHNISGASLVNIWAFIDTKNFKARQQFH